MLYAKRWGSAMRSPKKYARAAVRVIGTNVRLGLGKVIHGRRLRYAPETCLAFSDSVELSAGASLAFGRNFRTRGRCLFNVQGSGSLSFGDDVFLNSGCQFNCRSSIAVGSGTEFGPNVLVYDHDHAYRGGILKEQRFLYSSVSIGRDCWIGAGSIILRGATIGDGCVIAAGSIVKGQIPPGSLFLQKRHKGIYGAQ